MIPNRAAGQVFYMGDIGAIIFDLGRVVVDIDVEHFGCGVLGGIAVDNPDAAIQQIMADELVAAFNMGKISPENFHKAICEKYGAAVSYSEFVRLWCGIFKPMPGIVVLLEQLRAKVGLGLLSNTDKLHWDYLLREYPEVGIFDKPTLSFEAGVMKPSPQIYLAAAENVDTAPGNCLCIDDLQVNVDGARRVGMDAVLFEGVQCLRRDLVARGILEL